MTQTIEENGSLAERANELYWSGSMTVEDIVADIGISRTALYSSIEPHPAGIACAECNGRMVFSNRTMRDRGIAVCTNCGQQSEAGEPGTSAASRAPQGRNWAAGAAAFRGAGRWREMLYAISPERVALVGGGAALGIIAGALVTRVLRS